MSIIEVEHLAKTFKTREREAGLMGSLRSFIAPCYREREAVKSISFSLAAGEVLAFISPNGAGKSTTIKMLTGIKLVVSWTQYSALGEAKTLSKTLYQFRL